MSNQQNPKTPAEVSVPAERAPKGKWQNIVLWVLQVLLAAAFLMAGSMKLSGNPTVIQNFDKLGLGRWFGYFTGSVEVLSAILLLVPRLASVGGGLLVCTMIGAITAHLTKLGGSPAAAIVLGVIAAIIAWARRGRLRG